MKKSRNKHFKIEQIVDLFFVNCLLKINPVQIFVVRPKCVPEDEFEV